MGALDKDGLAERTRFALVGAAGYIAPRHMKAMKDLGVHLAAAFDPTDSVGVLDRYFPDTDFFVEFERFERHLDALRDAGNEIDYVSICSPNHLHDDHCRFALGAGMDVICEKPLVLNPENVDGLASAQAQSGRRINTIMQLRLHPEIMELKERVARQPTRIHDVDLTYLTPRGPWYHVSWKGDVSKSGGIMTNIGIHLFDLLVFIFGGLRRSCLHLCDAERAAGYLEFDRARVRWFISVNRGDISQLCNTDRATYRSISVDGSEIDLSNGFDDLHTKSYREILAGRGFGLDVVRSSIELVAQLRTMKPVPRRGDQHPFLSVARFAA